ncbi:hypothetical protein JL722_9143 [Aureococcus anophagefferens]|nr:hypothetical protein JL722_9143 [Aureococcus anophagefferens]
MAAPAPRSIVPRVAFGFNSSVSTPVVALEQESLTYITFTGSAGRAAAVVYSLAQCGGAWVPTVVGTHTWDEAPGGATFGAADFNADASLVVCASKAEGRERPSVAVGFDWAKPPEEGLAFCSPLEAACAHVCCHPRDPLELSTSGPQHVQLWRLLRSELKPRAAASHLPPGGGGKAEYTIHLWLESEMLVAGTSGGDVAIVQENEQTQRFEGVHLSSVRGVVPLEHGFATCCSSCGVCVFRRDDDPRQRKRGKLLLTTDPKAKRLPAKRLGAPHHEGDVMALSAGLSKPLLASCSTVGGAVCVWDWRARELAVRYVGDEAFAKQALVCLDVHPGGYELLVGLEDEMRVYRLGHRELFLAQKLATKGVVPLPRDDRPLVSTTPLSALAYANGGHLFAAVMGRLVQVFESRATREAGRAGLLHALRGHAGNVRGLAWAPDDQRLFTVSEDGAVYEWSIGRFEDRHRIVARTRDCVRLGVKWACMCVFDDGALVAAGAPRARRTAGAATRASLKQAQAFGGPSDEMVLIERGAFYKLENDVRTLVGQLEQTKAAAKQQQDAARPEFERRLGEQEESYEAQLEALETEVDGKLATEAARYMAIRDEIDKIRLDARDELESQVLDSRKSEEKWKKSKESLKETYEAEARLLRDYAAQGKREASGLLEEQDRRADLELFAAREAARADLEELQRKLTTSLHDKARGLREAHERLAADREKQLDDLVRWKRMLGEQKASLEETIAAKDGDLAALEKKWRKLDGILEDAGMQNKAMGITLNRKANELQRARTRVGECRKHIFSKDKRLGGLVEQIDVFLLKPATRDPPQAVVLELHAVRDAVNLELMEELNDLRFDRKSLHRKLRDEQFKNKWGKRAARPRPGDDDDQADHASSVPELVPIHAQTVPPDFRTKLPDHLRPLAGSS